MLEIIEQEKREKKGNNCIIKDCFIILKCFNRYIVLSIRKYDGYENSKLDYRGIKEFEDISEAIKYYKEDLRKI